VLLSARSLLVEWPAGGEGFAVVVLAASGDQAFRFEATWSSAGLQLTLLRDFIPLRRYAGGGLAALARGQVLHRFASARAFYFTPATRERGAALGLDPLQTYVVGRGGVLGDVEASVVASAFGYFNPAFLAGVWNAGTAACAPRAAGRMFWEASAEHGRARLAEVPGLAAFVAAAFSRAKRA
jgi:hypothetical protein